MDYARTSSSFSLNPIRISESDTFPLGSCTLCPLSLSLQLPAPDDFTYRMGRVILATWLMLSYIGWRLELASLLPTISLLAYSDACEIKNIIYFIFLILPKMHGFLCFVILA